MHPNAELLTRFYTAFSARDADGMAACYHSEVQFSDPAFPDLKGWRAAAMWRMLCERGKDLELTFSDVDANDTTGNAKWEAKYTFGATGRKVHNRISASFEFKDGLISKHTDDFDFHTWAKQAIGPMGLMLGWTGFMKNKVQSTAGDGLDKFIEKRGLGPQ